MPTPPRKADTTATTAAVAARTSTNTPAKRGDTIFDLVERSSDQFARALPAAIPPERFLRQALTTLRTTKGLPDCDTRSVLGGLMLAAQLGLEPGGPLGQSYLIPFGGQAQFIIGYKGYIDLARRSGNIESIIARPIYANDHFEADYGLEDRLVHKPDIFGDRGELIGVYAFARYVGGGHSFEVLSLADVEKYRARSKAKNSGPWVTDYEAMAKKTAVRRLATWLPLSTEVQHLMAVDEAVGQGIDARVSDYSMGDVIDLDDGDHTEDPPAGVDTETGEVR